MYNRSSQDLVINEQGRLIVINKSSEIQASNSLLDLKRCEGSTENLQRGYMAIESTKTKQSAQRRK